MRTRSAFPLGHSLSFTLALLLLAGLLGCSKPDQPVRQKETGPGADKRTAADTHGGHDGGEGESLLMVRTEPVAIKPGSPVLLRLMIHDQTGAVIKDFEIIHEKKLHLIIVREELDRFAHIHPETDRLGNITGWFTFPVAGKYRLYADHKPAGKDMRTAISQVLVGGTPPPGPALVPDAPGRVTGDGLAADLTIEQATAGATTRISFALFDAAGRAVADLQPYLGAMGHLVILSADGRQYVHAHPLAGKAGGAVAFEARFPHPGIYKGWGQFQRAGTVYSVPFVVALE